MGHICALVAICGGGSYPWQQRREEYGVHELLEEWSQYRVHGFSKSRQLSINPILHGNTCIENQ